MTSVQAAVMNTQIMSRGEKMRRTQAVFQQARHFKQWNRETLAGVTRDVERQYCRLGGWGYYLNKTTGDLTVILLTNPQREPDICQTGGVMMSAIFLSG